MGYVDRELEAPDKWKRLEEEVASLPIAYAKEEDKFSAREFEELQNRISILKQGIEEIPLRPEQLKAINAKLDYLSDKAKDFNKFDWKSLFVGTIIAITIQLSVSPANAKALWDLIKQTFSGYFLP